MDKSPLFIWIPPPHSATPCRSRNHARCLAFAWPGLASLASQQGQGEPAWRRLGFLHDGGGLDDALEAGGYAVDVVGAAKVGLEARAARDAEGGQHLALQG